jgi:hypothetical protein
MSIFTGPTAFATPPKLNVFELAVVIGVTVLARIEAVVPPSVNAMLFDTNPLRDDDDDDDDDDTGFENDESAVMCNLVVGT